MTENNDRECRTPAAERTVLQRKYYGDDDDDDEEEEGRDSKVVVQRKKQKKAINASGERANRMLVVYMKRPKELIDHDQEVRARVHAKLTQQKEQIDKLIQTKQEVGLPQLLDEAHRQVRNNAKQQPEKKANEHLHPQPQQQLHPTSSSSQVFSQTSTAQEKLSSFDKKKRQMNQTLIDNAVKFKLSAAAASQKLQPPTATTVSSINDKLPIKQTPLNEEDQVEQPQLSTTSEQRMINSKPAASETIFKQQEKMQQPKQSDEVTQSRIIAAASRLLQSTEASKSKATSRIQAPKPVESPAKESQIAANAEILERQKTFLEKLKENSSRQILAEEVKLKREADARERLRMSILAEVRKNRASFVGVSSSTCILPAITPSLNNFPLQQRNQALSSTYSPAPPPATAAIATAHPVRRFSLKVEGSRSTNKGGEEEQLVSLPRARAMPNVRNFKEWKKKQKLPDSTKVFIIRGGYGDFKKALLARGWVENPQIDSPCFDMLFTLMGKDIDHERIEPFQFTNHFQKNQHLSTKAGLLKSLRNLPWTCSEKHEQFFPQCFYLNDQADQEAFVEQFKQGKALAILKKYVRLFTNEVMKCLDGQGESESSNKKEKKQRKNKKKREVVDLEKLRTQARVALKVLTQLTSDVDTVLDDQVTNQKANALRFSPMCDADWKILEGSCCISSSSDKDKFKETATASTAVQVTPNINSVSTAEEDVSLLTDSGQLLEKLKGSDDQFSLRGEDNVWILKPAGLSRGRGITCHNKLPDVMAQIKSSEVQMHLVIQKYIENPLIVHERKFDIRAWVVVVDWNPVSIWYFDEFYLRFSAEEYSTDDLANVYQHLTNNAISKNKGEDVKNIGLMHSSEAVNMILEQGNMFTQKQFEDFLDAREKQSGVFAQRIKPRMLDIFKIAINGCTDVVEPRKNTFEIFGFDIMIDDQLNPWLIEVNTSPCMEYSTPITERLVKEMFADLPSVIFDTGLARNTGKFMRIHKGTEVFMHNPFGSVSQQFSCEGFKARIHRNVGKERINSENISSKPQQLPPVSKAAVESQPPQESETTTATNSSSNSSSSNPNPFPPSEEAQRREDDDGGGEEVIQKDHEEEQLSFDR